MGYGTENGNMKDIEFCCLVRSLLQHPLSGKKLGSVTSQSHSPDFPALYRCQKYISQSLKDKG